MWQPVAPLNSFKPCIRAKLIQLAPKATPLPSQLLAIVRSQENGNDNMGLRFTQQQDLTETWLHHNIQNYGISLGRRTVSGKMREICVYINDARCLNVVKVDRQCAPDVEFNGTMPTILLTLSS